MIVQRKKVPPINEGTTSRGTTLIPISQIQTLLCVTYTLRRSLLNLYQKVTQGKFSRAAPAGNSIAYLN